VCGLVLSAVQTGVCVAPASVGLLLERGLSAWSLLGLEPLSPCVLTMTPYDVVPYTQSVSYAGLCPFDCVMGCVVHAAMYAVPADLPSYHQFSASRAAVSDVCVRVCGLLTESEGLWQPWQGSEQSNHLCLGYVQSVTQA
jgi:hypothetical protein